MKSDAAVYQKGETAVHTEVDNDEDASDKENL
jgi:hypothetical protein